ncbi:MAG: nucleotidyl transferase AbiEii/AbiGii toxin family protein [Thermoanaerobaculales bacterium]
MKSVLKSVSAALVGTDFYLAGGTALALLEGHRISIDLDLFSQSFDDPEAMQRTLGVFHPDAVITSMSPRTLNLLVEGTGVSLFGYSYPLVAPLLRLDDSLIAFASREDIAAMKLAAITSRGSRKDFIDLWLLITRFWALSDCLELFRQKFAARDIGHVVRSLTYFDDADEEPPLRMLVDIEWESVKRDLAGWVSGLMNAESD